jgi:hypothetical protein
MQQKLNDAAAIWKICQLIDDEYLVRLAAPDQATVDRWVSDDLVLLDEGYRIRTFQSEHLNFVEAAVSEWEERSFAVVDMFGGSCDELIDWFDGIRSKMWRDKLVVVRSREDERDIIYEATERSRLVVINVGWCRDFGAILPVLIPEQRRSLARIGLIMSSIFYLEMIAKLRDLNVVIETVPLDDAYRFKRVDAYWRRAKALC